MIVSKNLSKNFGAIKALDNISLEIKNNNIFGLIGTNGAGKSTFLKMTAGILKPDQGSIKIDGEDIFENLKLKRRFFYISDEQFFLSNSTPNEMKSFYSSVYKGFDTKRFDHLMKSFELNPSRKIKTFSKGMKKQVSVVCGVCSNVDYLFCDETFDGLDPVARQAVKSIFVQDMDERGLTPIIASHNLREIEDVCDNIGLLHRGGMLLSKDLENIRSDIHKVQVAFKDDIPQNLRENIEIVKHENRGSLQILTVRGSIEKVQQYFLSQNITFFEILPLTLEEVFISETEVIGYDIKSLIL